jgi:hypothetical protein
MSQKSTNIVVNFALLIECVLSKKRNQSSVLIDAVTYA